MGLRTESYHPTNARRSRMKKVTIISNIVGRGAEDIPVSATGGAAGAGVDLSGLLRKSVWDSVFEIKTDANGVSYILSKLNFVSQRGITAFGDPEGLAIGSIYDGLPIDNRTIYWDNGVLKAKGGEGGGGGVADSVAWVDVYGKPSWITNNKPVYAYSEILNAPTMPTALSQLANDMGFVTEGAVNALRDIVAGKQDAITDLDAIRSGAALGATAVQRGESVAHAVSADRAAYAEAAPYAEFATYSGGINANQPMLALPTEANGIFVVDNEDGAITTNSVSVSSSIKKAIQFNWYNEPWEIGNVRGTGAYSEGFGITSGKDNLCFLVTKDGCYANGGRIIVEGDSVGHALFAESAANADTLDGMHGYSYFKSIPLTGDSVDFNNLTESGAYMNAVGSISNYQNAPFTYGYLLAFNTGNGYAQSLQIATSYSGDEIKVRQIWADSWTPWKSLAFTDGNVASADNATTAQLSDKSILLQGVESDDFSGTDLELNMKLFSGVSAGAEGLFPYGSNANAVLTINRHRGNYNSQLGFSSNGLLYYRNGSDEVLTTQPWKRIMFEGDNINILRGVDGKILINSGNGFASIGDGYFNDGDILYINGKSIAMRSSDTTDLVINPSGDVDVTKNLKVAKNLTVNGSIVTTSDVGTTIVYPWGVDIKAKRPSVNFFFGRGESITTRLIEHYAGSLFCEGTFIATKGLQSTTSITSGGDITSGGHITSNGHVYIPNNHGVVLLDTNGIPHRVALLDTGNNLLIGHDTASALLPTIIDGNAIYFRYGNGHYTGMTLNASGNVGIGTTEPAYKLEVVSGHYSVAMLESLQYPESSIVYKGNDKKSWAVGKGTGVTGDSFGFWSETKGGNVMLMRANGCVGIGTNDPRNELDILHNGEGLRLLSRNDKSMMLIQNVGGMNWEVGAMNNNLFAIRSTVWGGNVIVCNHSGDVGIGTSTLSARLNVGGSANVTENISVGGNASIGGTATIRGNSLQCRVLRDGANQWIIGKIDDADGAIGVGSVNSTQPIKLENLNGNAVLKSNGVFAISGDALVGGSLNMGGALINSAYIQLTGPFIQGHGENQMAYGAYSDPAPGFNAALKISGGFAQDGGGAILCASSGNVLIGTTTDSGHKLTVNGDSSVSGNILVGGGVTMYSQRSLKNVVDERGLSLDELATIKPTRYTWKDGRDERVHIGGIADDVERVMPEVVRRTKDGVLTMDYACAAFAMSASLIQPVSEHERRIGELERENIALRKELELLREGA